VNSRVSIAPRRVRDILSTDRCWTARPETEVPNSVIAKTRSVWVVALLLAPRHVAGLILVRSCG
jgi:hypothetical protein